MCFFAKPSCSSQTGSGPLGLKLKAKESRRTWNPKVDSESKESEARPGSILKQNEPVEILKHLYLGSEIHASQREVLERLGITSIVNVSRNIPNFFENTFHYKSIPVDDHLHCRYWKMVRRSGQIYRWVLNAPWSLTFSTVYENFVIHFLVLL